MPPAAKIPPKSSAVRPVEAARARIDCTLVSGIVKGSPPAKYPARLSAMISGDRSRTTLLSLVVTQTIRGAFAGIYWVGECTGTTELHAVTRGASGNRMGATRRRHIATSLPWVRALVRLG